MQNKKWEFHQNQFNYFSDTTLTACPHIHREVELIYVENGNTTAFSDQVHTDLTSGDFYISFSHQLHYYRNTENGIYHIIVFSPDIISGLKNILLENCPKNYNIKSNYSRILGDFFYNLQTITKTIKYKETFQIGYLNQILAILLDKLELEHRSNNDNSMLSSLLDFCENNFSDHLDLDKLAEKFYMNKSYISHLFNQKLGVGFSYYINTLRIKEASHLISETKLTISEISEAVGFGSIRSFNRVFLKIMGTTPLKYRTMICSSKKQ